MDNNLGLTKFKHLRAFWCQKVIPLVYDESLSYYEMLCKLMHRINQLIDAINEIIDILEDHENRITSLETWREIIDTWKTLIDNWKSEMDAWKGTVDEKLESIEDDIESIEQDIVGLGQDIANVQNDITDLYQTKQDVLTAGENITIEDNIISATGELSLLPATADRLGGVKIGEGVIVEDDGTISVEGGGYTLPTMSASTKGGAKLGDGLLVSDDVLSVDADNLDLSNNEIITNIQGDITDIQGDITTIHQDITDIVDGTTEIDISENTTIETIEHNITDIVEGTTEINISNNTTIQDIVSGDTPVPSTYELPIASANALGGVKVGSGLSIDALTGVLSAQGGGGYTPKEATVPVHLADTNGNEFDLYFTFYRILENFGVCYINNRTALPAVTGNTYYRGSIDLADITDSSGNPIFDDIDGVKTLDINTRLYIINKWDQNYTTHNYFFSNNYINKSKLTVEMGGNQGDSAVGSGAYYCTFNIY